MASFGPPPPRGPRKLAYSHLVQRAPQKCHFESYNGSDHDAMQKRRLASRVFGFIRHQKPYTNFSLTQPPRDCAAYASEDERLNTDVDGHLKELQRQSRERESAVVDRLGAEREYQRQKIRNKVEEDWEKDLERVQFFKDKPHARVQANRSGAEYDLFTLEYKNSFGGQQLKYEEDCQKWRANLRKMHLKSKSSSCLNYNILNWEKVKPPGEAPPKPAPPEPPAPSPGLPRVRRRAPPVAPPKHVLNTEETPEPCTDAGLSKVDYSEPPEPEPEVKVRDIPVQEQHPWEHYRLEAR